MKKWSEITLLSTILLASTFLIGVNSNAKTDNKSNNISDNKTWANRLSKNGYAFRLINYQNNNLKDLVLTTNPNNKPNKYYSSNLISKLINNKTNFKIKNIWAYKNGIQYQIESKNKKYKGWVNINNLYNKNLSNKTLNKFAIKENDFVNGKTNIKVLNNELNKIKGKNKKIAETSLKETKKYKINQSEKNIPALFFSDNPMT